MEQEGPHSLAAVASKKLLSQFADAFLTVSKNAMFASGGSISDVPHTSDESDKTDSDAKMPERKKAKMNAEENQPEIQSSLTSAAVGIRFDNCGQALSFPSDEQSPIFQLLIRETQPASFGFKGRECFNPYSAGIVDVINQLLLPSVELNRGVRAELYKLNIYSGPSDHFKAHVYTLRAKDQDDTPAIKWAAFYSDCEHEVTEVTSGHRVTLTYSLLLAHTPGLLTGNPKPMDATQLPLCLSLADMLACPGFMAEGGKLGVICSHAYPHTDGTMHYLRPDMLKGVDMALYEAANANKLEFRLFTYLLDVCIPVDDDYCGDMYFPGTERWQQTNDGINESECMNPYDLFKGLEPAEGGSTTWVVNEATSS